jgi:hypothetical protein
LVVAALLLVACRLRRTDPAWPTGLRDWSLFGVGSVGLLTGRYLNDLLADLGDGRVGAACGPGSGLRS